MAIKSKVNVIVSHCFYTVLSITQEYYKFASFFFFFFFLENILTYRLSNYCPVICLIPTRYVPNIHVIYLKDAHTVRTEKDHANLVNCRYSIVWLKYDRRQF